MEDLSKEMMPGKPISRRMRALLDKESKEARQRIIDRGIVHFRADREFMTALLDAADRLKIAPGTLCRRIVWEAIRQLPAQASSTSTVPGDLPPDVASLAYELKAGQDEIRDELRQIHELLSKPKRERQRSV